MANQSKLQPDSSPELTIKKRRYKCIVPGCNYSAPNGFLNGQKKNTSRKNGKRYVV